jgi:hypothetical protein
MLQVVRTTSQAQRNVYKVFPTTFVISNTSIHTLAVHFSSIKGARSRRIFHFPLRRTIIARPPQLHADEKSSTLPLKISKRGSWSKQRTGLYGHRSNGLGFKADQEEAQKEAFDKAMLELVGYKIAS